MVKNHFSHYVINHDFSILQIGFDIEIIVAWIWESGSQFPIIIRNFLDAVIINRYRNRVAAVHALCVLSPNALVHRAGVQGLKQVGGAVLWIV